MAFDHQARVNEHASSAAPRRRGFTQAEAPILARPLARSGPMIEFIGTVRVLAILIVTASSLAVPPLGRDVAFAQIAGASTPNGNESPKGEDVSRRPVSAGPEFAREADAWISDALARLEVVPGLAVAVVVDDTVVLADGWGMADVEAGIPATEETVFYIASATKSFTALAGAILDADGRVDLDSSVASHLNGVTLDPEMHAEEVRLRDLLTHTSGIDNDPIPIRLAYTGEHDPETLWRLLDESTPNEDAPLGTFDYTNFGYNLYTMFTDRELGVRWQDLLAREVFGPIGMERTSAYTSLPKDRGWPVAVPYNGLGASGVEPVGLDKTDATMQSAGGIVTTAQDLGRWIRFQLGNGRIDGVQVTGTDVVKHTHEPLVEASGRPPFAWHHYGLGWGHGDVHGRTLLHHSGGYPGFRSFVSFSPDLDMGVAIVANESVVGSSLVDVFATWIYDWWLSAPNTEDSIAPLLERRDEVRKRFEASRSERAVRQWALGRPRADYAGVYEDPIWGTVVIEEQDGDLEVRAGNLHCIATAFEKPETMRVELIPGQGYIVRFFPENIDEGPVREVEIDGVFYKRAKGR